MEKLQQDLSSGVPSALTELEIISKKEQTFQGHKDVMGTIYKFPSISQ